jgi:hypothetical protein
MVSRRLTPHQKIMDAARRMRGVRLTADEVTKLARDHAMQSAAQSDAEQAAERDACRAATGDSGNG